MNDQGSSLDCAGIVTLFDSLNMQKGDLSYRMEGMCQVVSAIAPALTDRDRKCIADSMLRACEAFGQFDKKSGVSINRYVLQTLKDLAF